MAMGDSAEQQPWTVLRLLNWTKEYFTRAGLDSARLSAEVLLSHVLRCKRIELYARYEYQPTGDELAAFRGLVKRAGEHEPIAYLIGRKEFYSLDFIVTPEVLIPRPETEIVVDQALERLKCLSRQAAVWDVCTGCGCIAVAVAANAPQATVLATDVSPAAVAVAARNAAAHKVADRVSALTADLLALPPDWAGPKTFDIITANPPYVTDAAELSAAVQREPALALRGGAAGLDLIERLTAAAPGVLAGGGLLAMEIGYDQRDAVTKIISATGQFAEPKFITDLQNHPRVALAVKTGQGT
ncbi:MAG: peptide chain release factor N(5)-glutamine methyltransferase [Planctomycetaceae bacterium]|nr:peptide chain release factor N(5)-glutamine methyltransferase [Planctomycetaceae bacterium]